MFAQAMNSFRAFKETFEDYSAMEKYFDINEQGYSIRCKLYCEDPREIARVVVCCHGFGGHKATRGAATFAQRIIAKWKGTGVVVFDWPCHGDDARKNLVLDECDAYLGIVAAHVSEAYATDELYAYGTSFGGYLILRYLALHGNPFRKIALRCPVIDMYHTFLSAIASEDDLRKLQGGKVVLVGFDRKVKVGKRFIDDLREADIRACEYFDYAEDILVLHGTDDEVVSFQESRAFADDNVIEFVPVEGADHRFRDPKKMDAAIARIIDFLRS